VAAGEGPTRSRSLPKLSAIDVRLEDLLRDREGRNKFADFLKRCGHLPH
jgi:hypothetical protein